MRSTLFPFVAMRSTIRYNIVRRVTRKDWKKSQIVLDLDLPLNLKMQLSRVRLIEI